MSLKTITVVVTLLAASACGSKSKKPTAAPGPNGSGNSAVSSQKATAVDLTARGAGGELDLAPIYFTFDDATLSDEARQHLVQVAAAMKKDASLELIVEGHCDERGTTEYNIGLGDRRAQAIKDYLADLGVTGKRVSTISYGKERPAVTGSGESAWAKNRRGQLQRR